MSKKSENLSDLDKKNRNKRRISVKIAQCDFSFEILMTKFFIEKNGAGHAQVIYTHTLLQNCFPW
jgi:hypothetical protein